VVKEVNIHKPDKDVIAMLEKYLDLAQEGKVTGVLLIVDLYGKKNSRLAHIGLNDRIKTLGMIAWAQHVFTRDIGDRFVEGLDNEDGEDE
jgi:hypothetical protein